MKTLQKDDKVKWNSSSGEVEGVVIKQITKPTQIKGFVAKPKDEKEYLVKSKSGAEAIHKISALTKVK